MPYGDLDLSWKYAIFQWTNKDPAAIFTIYASPIYSSTPMSTQKNFAHATTSQLSNHVQKMLWSAHTNNLVKSTMNFHHIWVVMEKWIVK